MAEWEQVLEEARHLYFEEQDYHSTHDFLWENVKSQAPACDALLLLCMSIRRVEYEEMLSILRKYPDSLEVKKGVAETWVERHPWETLDICDDLLATGSLTPREEIDVRWARIRATARQLSLHGGRYESLGDDFSALWNSGNAKSGRALMPYSRRRLLVAIAALHSPVAIPALQKLSKETWLSGNMRRFLELKVAELMALQELTPECE
jgi:hypothetical protein